MNAKTGALEWAFPTDDAIRFSPAAANGTVFFWSDGGILYAVSHPI